MYGLGSRASKMKLSGLSASSYSSYDWCQWRYYLSQILGFEDIAGPSALMGTVAHKVLELLSKAVVVKHPKNSKIWEPSYLWEICFNHYYNKQPLIAEKIENPKLVKVCKGIHDLLASEYTPIRENTISAEAKFNIPLEGKEFRIKGSDKQFTVRGRIDRVDKIDSDTVEIIDYKSGSRVCYESKDRHKKGPLDLYEDIQPKLYHLAGKHLYPWAKNILVTFIYLVDGGPVTVPFCDNDIEITKKIVKDRLRAIEANNNPQRNLTWKCKSMCSFQKNGICDHTWQEKDELGLPVMQNKYIVLNYNKRKH
jgi:hypothetical protein